ncbi:hypothetical protein [Polynucleobacter sp. es-MAR-4]|uniref:hypothetical protein n=1 Tax=Polynucleobacter sp. es-MAR-4 TaxID=1855655 RepID=UPI001C0C3B22|nr:hypothetical protein [Polynucleobacter sp. es-MAR-4]MBU3637922.1 hypothetical protein [Polynucleobacter sp. es-MAR-4]
MLATGIYLLALPTIEAELLIPYPSALLTLTTPMIGRSSNSIFSAAACDRYERRQIVPIGVLIFTATSITSIFINSAADLVAHPAFFNPLAEVVARFLQGSL